MLAARLLLHKIAPRDQRDARAASTVLDVAAECLGKPRPSALAGTLEAQDIKWAWQLAELSDDDWKSFDVPIGLKTAIRAELTAPTTSLEPPTVGSSGSSMVQSVVIDERLRRFLLIPDVSGKEVGPMSSVSAMFLALLTIPVADRQNLMLALCELLALISGLFLPISLDFRRSPALAAVPADKGWDVAPTLLDAMDAVALAIFNVNVMLVFFAVVFALFVATCGYHPEDDFCESAMLILGMLICANFILVLVPTFYSVMWHVFTDSASPYAAIGGIAVTFVIISVLNHVMFKHFMLEHYTLEFYHLPRFMKSQAMQLVPWLGHQMRDKAIRPKAERRAAKLRERLLGTTAGATATCSARQQHERTGRLVV